MVINSNLPATSSARLLADSSAMLAKSLARLSSGSKIISPEDDAAGLAVSMRFDAQINRIGAVTNNVNNAVSFSQTQDGFLSKVSKALDRMSELAVLAQDVTKQPTDISAYNSEFQKLGTYVSDLASKAFNSVALFGAGTNLNVTTDPNGGVGFTMSAVDLSTTVAAFAGLDLTTGASAAQTAIQTQVDAVAMHRADVGSNISVLNSYSSQLGVLKDNLSSADSRIKDVDVAEESTIFARYNILVQSGTAMLAQANQSTQSVLKLLQ